MALARKLPPATLSALIPHVTLRDGRLVSAANLPALVAPLKAASASHPRLHAVWDAILTHGLRVPMAAAASGDAPASLPNGGDASSEVAL